MNKKQTEEVLKELDMTEVVHKLSNMALKLVSGEKIKEKTYSVSLSIPEELGEVFELIANKSGILVGDILGYLAKQGYETSLKQLIQQQKQQLVTPTPIEQDTNPSLNGLMDKMNQFQGVMNQLQQMQKMMDNVNDNVSKNQTNNLKLAVSPNSIPCSKDGKK